MSNLRRLIQGFAAPALPLPSLDYDPSYFNRFNSFLRLYFSRIDAAFTALFDVNGASLLNAPYGAFLNAATQTLGASNTPTLVSLDTTQGSSGMTLAGSKITFAIDGLYRVGFNLQTANSSASIQDATVWLRKNGTDIPFSAFLFTVTEKHGAVDGRADQMAEFGFLAEAADYIEIYWAATSTSVSLYYEPEQTVPYAHPSVPSAYVTVTFISAV